MLFRALRTISTVIGSGRSGVMGLSKCLLDSKRGCSRCPVSLCRIDGSVGIERCEEGCQALSHIWCRQKPCLWGDVVER